MSNFIVSNPRPPMLRYEMTMTDFEILLFLWQAPRSVADIAALLGVAPGAVGVYMHRLRKRGYADGKRKRLAMFWLTEKGQGVVVSVGERIAGCYGNQYEKSRKRVKSA